MIADAYIWIAVWVVIMSIIIINIIKNESKIADDILSKMFEYLEKRERKTKTMARYIDADTIDLERVSDTICQWQAQEAIDDTPTADVVPVVRCKDCKHWRRDVIFQDGWCRGRHQPNPNWFCADGERRTDDDRA